jgi:hypothetical protein
MPVSLEGYVDISAWIEPGGRHGLIDFKLPRMRAANCAEPPPIDELCSRDRPGHAKRDLRDRNLGGEAQTLRLVHAEP